MLKLPNKKWWSLPLLFVVVLSLSAANPLANPPTAKAVGIPGVDLPDPCDLIPDGTARKVCKYARNPQTIAGDAVDKIPGVPNPNDLVDSAANKVAGALVLPVLQGLARASAAGTGYALHEIVRVIGKSTQPDLSADWFIQQYAWIFGLASIFALGFGFTRATSGAVRKDLGESGKAGFSLVAFLAAGGLIPLIVGASTSAVNTMSQAWLGSVGADTQTVINNMVDKFDNNINSIGWAVLAPFLVLLAGTVGGLVFEGFLLVTQLVVLPVVAALEVVACAMLVGGRWGEDTFKRCTMTLIALISLPLVTSIVLVFSIKVLSSDNGASPIMLSAIILIGSPILVWQIFKRISGHNVSARPVVAPATAYVAGLIRK